jgi:hypothetical protein
MACESRSELIAWYNDLAQENYQRVEQFGTGAAHCVIMDSIFRDVCSINIDSLVQSQAPSKARVRIRCKFQNTSILFR